MTDLLDEVSFDDLTIGRIIAHEAPKLSPLTEAQSARHSTELQKLSDLGKDALKARLTTALGKNSRGVELAIEDASVGSAFDLCSRLLDSEDAEFVAMSQRLATKLTTAQSAPGIKPGLVVVLDGTVAGTPRKRFVAIIKAESDSGFIEAGTTGSVLLEFIERLFLGTHQRLFKIGCFVEKKRSDDVVDGVRNVDDFSALVFDHQMNPTGEKSAALYFFKAFMGCAVAKNARHLTRLFLEHTTDFINGLTVPIEQRVDLKNSLTAYLRSQKASLSVTEFADDVLEPLVRPAYRQHMKGRKFPLKSVVKDTTTIKGRLRTRRFTFPSRIKLVGPEEAFNKSVRFEGTSDGWTTIRIEGTAQEE